MLLAIDHIVIVVRDLEAAIKSYQQLGFTVVPGGRHPVGTHNALISLADGAYLELIAFYEAHPKHRWWATLRQGGGLVDFCMQTDDLCGDTAALRGAGVDIDDPQPLTRIRPDGYQLKWLLSIPRERHRGVAPFLIQDETPRDERVPRETTHKNGAVGIGTVTVAVDDLRNVRSWYRAVLGYDGEPLERGDIPANGILFKIGPHCLDFLEPQTKESPLGEWLKRRGPSPYSATLRTTSGNRAPLNKILTHGAALSFE